MSDRPQVGRFVHHELLTSDVPAAVKFYTDLFGWTIQEFPMGDMVYQFIKAGDVGIGGIVSSGPGHPHWVAYISTDDVDATTKKVVDLGGQQMIPPMDIPGVGRFSAVTDPHGAEFRPYKHGSPPAPEHGPEGAPIGQFCWNELMTSDREGAAKFYSEVFGWKTEAMDMGDMTYTICKRGDAQAAGIMTKPKDSPMPPMWLGYVHVADSDASCEKLEKLGGKAFMKGMDIPNIGRMSICADPQGAPIALFTPAKVPAKK